MSPEEETKIGGLISNAMKVKDAEHEANYKLIDFKLGTILEQTTKHNERMTKVEERCDNIEKNEIAHIIECPQVEKVRALEDTALSQKSIKKWIVGSVGITGGMMGILWIIFQIATTGS